MERPHGEESSPRCEPDMVPLTSPVSNKRKREDGSLPELEIDVSLPEPPSKKALRRAKKEKHTATSLPNLSNGENTDQKSASGSPAAAPLSSQNSARRTDYSIWIGNLPWAIDKAMLRTFITEHSSITDDQITRVNMPAPQDAKTSKHALKPQNKGFAYVDFASSEPFKAALAMSETLFGGRRVLIKDAKSFYGRPEKETLSKDGKKSDPMNGKKPSRRVFVGNLGFDVTREALATHFEKCGEVEHVHMATFEDTGKCKGFAWVTFNDLEAGAAAVRGWTLLPAADEGEDEVGGGELAGQDQEQSATARKKVKKIKPKKWFVNLLFGRPLRCEFAEDPTIRYKKRFGKDVSQNQSSEVEERHKDDNIPEKSVAAKQKRSPHHRLKPNNDITPGELTDDAKRRGRNTSKLKTDHEQTRYRTGAIAESQGSKTVFS